MRKIKIYSLIVCVSFLVTNCNRIIPVSINDDTVPEIYSPTTQLNPDILKDYTLAYCWQSTERDAFGQGRTDIIVRKGAQQYQITYPVASPQTPLSLGCFGTDEQLRSGGRNFSWRPNHNQLGMAVGTLNPPGDNLYLVNVPDNLDIKPPQGKIWQHEEYFLHPSGVQWSPNGEWLMVMGEDASNPAKRDGWLYQPEKNQGIRAIDTEKTVQFGNAFAWSLTSTKLAGIYANKKAGIAVLDIDSLSLVSITSSRPILGEWPYKAGETISIVGGGFELSTQEWTQWSIVNSSRPIWIESDSHILFVGPTLDNRVTLFKVSADGQELSELRPNFSGLIGNLCLSPDGTKLVFSRYPNWEDLTRVEIAVIDLKTSSYSSLVALAQPKNGDTLIVGGIDWTPDSKYIALSANQEGESDVYVMSIDEFAWVNLTADKDGDAVFPLWKP